MRLSRQAHEAFWRLKCPNAVLEYAASFPQGPAFRPLRQTLEKAFREVEVDLLTASLPAVEFLGIVAGLKLALDNTRANQALPPDVAAFAELARVHVSQCYEEYWSEVVGSLATAVSVPLVAHSRLDTQLLTFALDWKRYPKDKQGIRVTLSAQEPQIAQVTLDGRKRPAYRAANTWSGNGVEWLSWDGGQIGRGDGNKSYPVYVQTHALRQLSQRLNLPAVAPYLQSWLSESLRQPQIVDRHGRDLVVAYRIKQHRLGYVITSVLDDLVVVRTFKFLTMQGTPEARQLHSRLGLTRSEIDWLRLSELSAFTDTDLRQDAKLRELMEKCGCGHLLRLDEADYIPTSQGYAAEIRRYLRLAA